MREAKARSMTRTKHQQLQHQQQLQHEQQHQHQQRRRLKRVVAYARIRPSSKESPQSAKTEKIRGEEDEEDEEEEEEEEERDDDDDDDDLHKEEGEKKTRASLTDPRVVETARGRFRVDHAFGEDATQRDVWDAIGEPALTDVMKGETACVLAYGQTGAGKTYALLNTPETTDLENETRRAKRRDDDCGRKKDSRKDEEDEEDEDEAEEERRNSAGLVPRLAVELFGRIEKEKKKKKKKLKLKLKKKDRQIKTSFVVEISMMQIYNEIVDDLFEDLGDGGKSATKMTRNISSFNGKTSRTKNVVRRNESTTVLPSSLASSNDICNNNYYSSEEWEVEDLTWIQCASASMLLQKFTEGRKRLRYAETRMNKHSSRSHCILNVRVKKSEREKRSHSNDALLIVEQSEGVLTVVDLAGSERQHKDYYRRHEINKSYPLVNTNDRTVLEELRFKEATRINQSLLALGNCVRALASNATHVPIRDSNLTKILCSSLNGRSRTWLLVCCSSEAKHASETAAALEFATRAMRVETIARSPTHKEILEIESTESAAAEAAVLFRTPRKSTASRSSTCSSSTNGTLSSDGDKDDSFDDDRAFDWKKNVNLDQREIEEENEGQRQRCTLRQHCRQPFTNKLREGKLRREIQCLRDELESLKIERAVAKQRAKENDEQRCEELETMKEQLNEKCSEVAQSLKATLRENSEKCELVASLQKENNVLLAKYREKCRQFELEREKTQTMLDHESRAKRIAESNHEREAILHTETRRKLERERTKSEKIIARCAAERLKTETSYQALQTLLEKNEQTCKEAEVYTKTLRLYHEEIKPSVIINFARIEDEKTFTRHLVIEKHKDAQRALQFRTLRDDFVTKLGEKNKLLESEKRRSRLLALKFSQLKEKIKAASKSLTDFKLAQREEMDKICTQGVVVYKLGDKNPSTKHTYERIVRVTSPRTTPNITTQNRVLQQGYVRWNASKTIPVQRLERVGLDNSKLLLHHLRRNLKRSQFAPFSFEEEEREKDKQEKDARS